MAVSWSLSRDIPQAQFVPAIVAGLALLCYLLIRRPALNWKVATGPLLLASVVTAAYGWSYDQIVLLVPYLEMIAWITVGWKSSKRKSVLIGCVMLMLGFLVLQSTQDMGEHAYVWFPLALAAVYGSYRYTRFSRG
jgi:hypothetical protein